MSRTGAFLILGLALLLAEATGARATEGELTLKRVNGLQGVPGLKLKVTRSPTAPGEAVVEGTWEGPEALLLDEHVLATETDGRRLARGFKVEILLKGEATELRIRRVAIDGELQLEKFVVLAPAMPTLPKARTQPAAVPVIPSVSPARWMFAAAAGLSVDSFEETGVVSKTSPHESVRVVVEFLPSSASPWGWGGSLRGNGFSSLALASAPQLGQLFAELHGSFWVPGSNTWRLRVLGGGYFATLFNTGSALGYRNLVGPMLFPVVSREFSQGRQVSFQASYSPVYYRSVLFVSGFRRLAAGMGYASALSGSRSWTLSLDYEDLALPLNPDGVVRTQALGVSVGYLW